MYVKSQICRLLLLEEKRLKSEISNRYEIIECRMEGTKRVPPFKLRWQHTSFFICILTFGHFL